MRQKQLKFFRTVESGSKYCESSVGHFLHVYCKPQKGVNMDKSENFASGFDAACKKEENADQQCTTPCKHQDHNNNKKLGSFTLLDIAAKRGYLDLVTFLLKNEANARKSAPFGYLEELNFLILEGERKSRLKNGDKPLCHTTDGDLEMTTALELAVANGHLQVVKSLVDSKKVNIHAKDKNEWTILHIASGKNNLEIVKYLVDQGCDVHAVNASGSKPIHIAAKKGQKDIVEFFLSKGLSVNEPDLTQQRILHYAVLHDHLNVVEFLIEKGADVNAEGLYGFIPIQIAAINNDKHIIEVLLLNGAIFDYVHEFYNKKPLDMATDKAVINLLATTEKLFEFVKSNNFSEVENCIREGAFIDAKDSDGKMPLHYAAWKGSFEIVRILMKNGANLNVVCSMGLTPMHYAARFAHSNIVKALMYYGAIYNAVCNSGKTPSDFTLDPELADLFKLINESFKKVKEGNVEVIDDLKNIDNIYTVKAVLSVRNRENRTLLVAAVYSKFSKIRQLNRLISETEYLFRLTKLPRFLQGSYSP